MAKSPLRTQQYFDFRVERGCVERWGPRWADDPVRLSRIDQERTVIHEAGYESFFLMLAHVLMRCDEEGIPVGPGRGSVGGSAVCYALKIHDVDPLRWGLYFERFMNPDRVEYPDVDVDLSQRHRPRVLEIVREEFGKDGNVVLQVAAFQRLGGRSNIDAVFAALSQTDPNAGATAENLRKCLPKGNITMGTKQDRELAWWMENGHGDRERFMDIAEQSGWLETMMVPEVNDVGELVDVRKPVSGVLMKLDSLPTNLAKHAAGVVILGEKDLPNLPQTGLRGQNGELSVMTGYDMYALGSLKYLKWDFLGLRTLDIISDADKLTGGDGSRDHLIKLWLENMEDPRPYKLLCEANTMGIFQMETDGYRKTLREFQPSNFEHIVHLNALYRPGALDAKREDGKNMVEVYIDRRHHREPVRVPENHPRLAEILLETQGIILFQEQAMRIAQDLAGFTLAQADELRKAIGKKRLKEMAALEPVFKAGIIAHSGAKNAEALGEILWQNVSAAARYSWNKSHAVEYGAITWLTAWFKAVHPAAFYCALINSYGEDRERQAEAVAEARQGIKIKPPDVNIAQADFGVDDGALVFGFNGIKGMGDAGRHEILLDRTMFGPYTSFQEFCQRLPSLNIGIKKSLIACGAFESMGEDRCYLLATAGHKKDKPVTVADLANHNSKLKKARELPPMWEVQVPSEDELAQGELDAIGFYITTEPMARVNRALARLERDKHYGGKITSVKTKNDRRGNEMAFFTILTPSLNKQRCTMFASVYERYSELVREGQEVIIRGGMDGSSLMVDALFEPGDYRHFGKIQITNNGDEPQTQTFDGRTATLESLEQAGYTVTLL